MTPFPTFNVHKACRHGVFVFNPHDQYVGKALETYGEYSQGEIVLFEKIVRPGDVVIEVGANMGAHTVRLAQLAGPTGGVWAFEPQRILYQTLCGNLALNSITNTWARNEGVSSTPGTLAVPSLNYAHGANYGALALGPEADWASKGVPLENVPVTTIDSLDLPSCRFIKIDVEGMEAEVIIGAKTTILKHRPWLYVENDRPANADRLVKLLTELNYQLFWHTPPLYNPANVNRVATNLYPGMVSINVLAVPSEHPEPIVGLEPVTDPVHPIFRKTT